MILDEVVMTMVPNKRDGNKRPTHSSMSWCDNVSRGDDALVDSAVQLDDNLTRSVIVDVFEFVDVACVYLKERNVHTRRVSKRRQYVI